MKIFKNLFKSLVLITLCATLPVHAQLEFTSKGLPAPWSSDPGLDPKDPVDRRLLDVISTFPYMPGFSERLMGYDKFRKTFGPTFWRAVFSEFQIIGMGQDATHIAEFAGRTATAGFGGRVQHYTEHFGVRNAVWINAFANTIKGQYGAYESPIISFDRNGQPSVRFSGFVDTAQWLMANDLDSAMVKARNEIIELLILKSLENAKANGKKVQMFALFGGAARDAMAKFIESRGGAVARRISEDKARNTQVPEMQLKYAGGNNQFPVPLTTDGKDMYEVLLGRKLDYKSKSDQKAAKAALERALKRAPKKTLRMMALSKGGPQSNGMIDRAQLGGYDLTRISVDGKIRPGKNISLKGLRLSNGTVIDYDLLVAQFPHPSSLSRMTKAAASAAINRLLELFAPYKRRGWKIIADAGVINKFARGIPFVYGRADIGPEYYDFGTPKNRMVPVSTASRSGHDKIIGGTRDRAKFDENRVRSIQKAQPVEKTSREEILVTRPRGRWIRAIYDRGPGRFARLMIENLDMQALGAPKDGRRSISQAFNADGIQAFNIKTHPIEVSDFAHYRGTFRAPTVVTLYDPFPGEYNDLVTSRAATGHRGQFLQGLMNQVGVGEKHLVFKTLPVGMDGATDREWRAALKATNRYREAVLRELVKQKSIQVFVADGKYAAAELKRILNKLGDNRPVVTIQRGQAHLTSSDGLKQSMRGYGMQAAATQLAQKLGVRMSSSAQALRAAIPRSHLPYLTRWSEGLYGDLVLPTVKRDKNRGRAFLQIMPEHAHQQEVAMDQSTQRSLDTQVSKLFRGGFRMPDESISTFMRRKAREARSGVRQLTQPLMQSLSQPRVAKAALCEAAALAAGM